MKRRQGSELGHFVCANDSDERRCCKKKLIASESNSLYTQPWLKVLVLAESFVFLKLKFTFC